MTKNYLANSIEDLLKEYYQCNSHNLECTWYYFRSNWRNYFSEKEVFEIGFEDWLDGDWDNEEQVKEFDELFEKAIELIDF